MGIRPQRLIGRNDEGGNGRLDRGHAAQPELWRLVHGSQGPAIRCRAGKGPCGGTRARICGPGAQFRKGLSKEGALGRNRNNIILAMRGPTLFRRGRLTASTIRPERLKEGLHLGQLRRMLGHSRGQSRGPSPRAHPQQTVSWRPHPVQAATDPAGQRPSSQQGAAGPTAPLGAEHCN
ncbi:hypothetical protein GOODEAATRI_003461 [Goodea atripinnis]|uniref:Uncharacterized protein n=1 Tax=Goodea atripinnis TaxID=208336 RepID=A0ABV0MER7_9TELE